LGVAGIVAFVLPELAALIDTRPQHKLAYDLRKDRASVPSQTFVGGKPAERSRSAKMQ